jgi:hypothetical protein
MNNENVPRKESDVVGKWAAFNPLLFILSLSLCFLAISIGFTQPLDFRFPIGDFNKPIKDYIAKNGNVPGHEKWCDEIEAQKDRSWQLTYTKAKQPQLHWSMNRHVIALDKNIPDDMVLLFESAPGWNQIGGIEQAKEMSRRDVQIIFGNGDTKRILMKNIDRLRWQVNQKANLYSPKPWFIAISTILVTSVITIITVFRSHLKRHWKLTIGITIVASIICFFLGAFSTNLYRSNNRDYVNYIYLFAAPGLLSGICFVPVLGKLRTRPLDEVGFMTRSVFYGAVTGAICSTVVHVYIMIYCQDSNILKPLGGAGFGIIAGMILGGITAGIMQRNYKKQACCNTATEMETNETNKLH